MTKFNKIFTLAWKSGLVVAVFFITFTSTNILINSWKNILSSEQLQNFIHGGKYLVIGDAKLKILLSDTEEERSLGLSGREKLDKNQGMLFMFGENNHHGIWMKDMKFSIDIIWLNSKFQVVDFISDVSPESYPTVFKPKKLSKYVLEVNSGFIKENGIKIDDQATFLD
jgi:uncharacterized membrane protein (UPF0127 family)